MDNNLQVFSSEEFGEVRTVVEDEQLWFVGKDVANALGYANTRKALKDHVDEDDKGVTKWYTPGGKQSVVIINESGLYSLVLSSKLQTAKKFKRWIVSEVLPKYQLAPLQKNSSELQIFSNDNFGEIRVIEEDGKILFCGSDIAKALGYSKPNNAIAKHCRATLKRGITLAGRMQEINFIPEGDVYRLIVRSKLPSAEKFESWVFDEVLPIIRKTGGYVANNDKFLDFYIPDADEATRTKFNMMVEVGKELNRQIRELKDVAKKNEPKVVFYDAVSGSDTSISVREMAKLLNQNGFPIGQKKLFQWLRDNGYSIKVKPDKNDPTQRSIDLGIMEVKESIVYINGDTVIRRTSKITAKGQQYFIKKFMEEKERECV